MVDQVSARLKREAAQRNVVLPHANTVAKYGWTLTEWLKQLESQAWLCPVCGRFPGTGKFVTDHEHVRGWHQMPDDERKLYIRGLTCWTCNRYLLARGISVEAAENIAQYLRTYEERRPA